MKQTSKLAAIAISIVFFAACQKETNRTSQPDDVSANTASKTAELSGKESSVGHVYTLSNQVSGNRVMEFSRDAGGSLSFIASYATGGNGTGGGLGNQGAVILGEQTLIAVNAGSNTISSFKIANAGLSLVSTISSGGIRPVSVTRYNNLVFVLNADAPGNISGFTINDNGMLSAIAGSTRPLSAANVGPAQIEFVNEGTALVITEKATNKIITYTVNASGVPGAMHMITSSNPTPFGFAMGRNGLIFVSEAVGGAPGASTLSSYHIDNDGTITLVDGPVGANQSAACWLVITNNGKYAYVTNTADNNLSTFNIDNDGNINVHTAISATTPAGPIDAALSNNSKFLYVLNSGSNSISAFAVANEGGLSNLQTVPGLPAGATGLAAK